VKDFLIAYFRGCCRKPQLKIFYKILLEKFVSWIDDFTVGVEVKDDQLQQ
jgi:hypothetical protein